MTTYKFRKQFDANLYEIYWLQEVEMRDKLALVRDRATKRIIELQKNNQELDSIYLMTLSADEPHKYKQLNEYLQDGEQRVLIED